MTRDANPAFARTLVDEWVRAGVTEAVLAPGSRSTPLALALAGDSRMRLHVFVDERSAAFFALGVAKASGRPVVVLCTSGTAAAELFPAVVEARHSRTPLLVCTADRPPELRDTGAGQAIDQIGLFGSAPRWFVEVGTPDAGAGAGSWWRSLASRAFAEAVGPLAGPIHLNLAFRDPLVPVDSGDSDARVAEPPGRPDGRPWTVSATRPRPPHPADVEALVDAVGAGRRGVLMAGWGANVAPGTVQRFSAVAGWPVLADPLSGARAGDCAVSTYDALLRDQAVAAALRPDMVVRIGAALTNKAAVAWADDSVPQVLVDPDNVWLDPLRTASVRLAADPDALLSAAAERLSPPGLVPSRRSWLDTWSAFETAARLALDGLLDSWDAPFEGRVARDVVACLPDGATLVVGSSMPVRDVESFARPRTGVRFLSNRGANGIDGFVSTVLGAAAGGSGPVAALCGDLTFLHDAGGLLRACDRGLGAVFVVVDNDGGGLFSFLPQAGLPSETFEQVFATPHGVDLAALAGVYGVPAERVDTAAGLVPAVVDAVKAGGVRIVVVTTDRADNVARHRQVWRVVADAVGHLSRSGPA